MHHFMAHTAKLNPWFPTFVIPMIAWLVTSLESTLGLALLFGYRTRLATQLSGWLLLAFAVGMTAGAGIKSALNASVFAASAGAFLWAKFSTHPLSIDAFTGQHRPPKLPSDQKCG